jgi:ankyrin repeat protein
MLHALFLLHVSFVQLLRNKCPVNGTNEHGNTPLHYACFWNYESVAEVRILSQPYKTELYQMQWSITIENQVVKSPFSLYPISFSFYIYISCSSFSLGAEFSFLLYFTHMFSDNSLFSQCFPYSSPLSKCSFPLINTEKDKLL